MDLGPLSAEYPTRTIEEEEEEAAEGRAHRCLEPAIVLLSSAIQPKKKKEPVDVKLLVVGCTPLSCALLSQWTKEDQIVGSVVLPEVVMTGNAIAPCLADKTAFIYQLDADVLVVACQHEVAEERAVAWTDSVLSHIKPHSVLVAGALQGRNYRGDGDPSERPLFFGVQNSSLCSGGGLDIPPPLPPGNVQGGLAAALLTHCELHRIPASLIIQIEGGGNAVTKESMKSLAEFVQESARSLGSPLDTICSAAALAQESSRSSGVTGYAYT
ncbi:unnamed protein product [Ostreobium quekettii]|uniref:Uncharacterized protein n=1 Tax=Ostreobium quekettii TaxID=121088 RepID=A0A8S1JEV9_9CHLO|nr:unnamed protein product [Ostreobium quekettii]|eukprot:evm.model.scf_178.4 EVM.evm.TU.scf_178.4   scf_178:48668-54533(-)